MDMGGSIMAPACDDGDLSTWYTKPPLITCVGSGCVKPAGE